MCQNLEALLGRTSYSWGFTLTAEADSACGTEAANRPRFSPGCRPAGEGVGLD